MVAIVTGAGYGMERSSGFILGARGQVGDSTFGRAGVDAFVNAATGTVLLHRTDEFLIGRGPDQMMRHLHPGTSGAGYARLVYMLMGTVNTAGSSVMRTSEGGDSVKFTYDTTRGAYVSREGSGAYDEMRWINGAWSCKDGDTQAIEYYERLLAGAPGPSAFYNVSRIVDIDGNTTTFGYVGTSTKVNSITTSDGSVMELTYHPAGGLAQLKTTYLDSLGAVTSMTRVRYTYDSSQRLSVVTVDLSPGDNSITDGNTYTINYGYDGTSSRLSYAWQTDGSRLDMLYDASGRISTLTETAATGVTRATTFGYFSGYTDVTDAQGSVTRLTYDAKKQLTQLAMPPAVAGGAAQVVTYTYNPNGDVTSMTDATGTTAYEYDSNGNQTLKRDPLGNTVQRAFGSKNELLRETVYLVPDPDGAGAGAATVPLTARYVYDTNRHLRFTVTGDGRVTQHSYNGFGQCISTVEYRAQRYDVSGLTPAQDITLATMTGWATGITDHSQEMKTSRVYDTRGNIQMETVYGTVLPDGSVGASDTTVTHYVYDQTGNLLSRRQGDRPAEIFVYDGLRRLTASTDANLNSTNFHFSDGSNSTIVTLANGLTQTSVYNRAGELVSYTESNGATTATTTFAYDSLGRLRIVTDATGAKTHHLYDRVGRKVAEIGQDGAIVEFQYNSANLLVRTVERFNKLSGAQLALLVDAGGNPTNVALSAVSPGNHGEDRNEWRIYDGARRLVETIDGAGAVTTFNYDGASRLLSTISYYSMIPASTVAGFTTATPTAPVLPGADPARDRLTRNFYDNDGVLIGTLDAEGGFTEHRYDGAGQPSKSIRYFNAAAEAVRASGTFAQILASIAPDTDKDIHSYSLFDNRGMLRGTIDGEGNLTRYRYQNLTGFLDQEIRGQKLDPAALLATPPSWNALPAAGAGETLETIDYARNGTGDVTTETRTLASGAAEYTTYSYDKLRKLLSSTVQGQNDWRTYNHRYDMFGRLIGELSGEGSAALEVLGANPAQATVDALYRTWGTTYSYDLAGRLVAMTRPNGETAAANRTLFYYDQFDRLRYEISAAGEVVEYRYNAIGDRTDTILYATRVAAGTLPTLNGGLVDTAVTTAVVASAGFDSRSHVDYNVTGTVKQSFDAIAYAAGLSYATTYGYNAFGELTSRVDPVDAATSISSVLEYDRRGLLKSETRDSAAGGLQLVTGFTYDAFGRQTEVRDPEQELRTVKYDRAGRIVRKTDATTAFELFSYDARGNVISTTDRNGKITAYNYTRFNRTITMTTPEGLTMTTVHNAHGETVSITDHEGRAVSYGYDKSGNLKTVTDAAGQKLNNYDKAGRLFEEIDANGVKTSYHYDAAARLMTRTVDVGGLNLTTLYEYDPKGRQFRITDPTLAVMRIEFDLNGREAAVIVDDGVLALRTAYSYDRSGRVLTVTEGAGTAAARVTKYDYDKAGRIVDSWVDPGGLNLRTHYVYDKNGNVTNVTDAAGRVTVYTYDDENRLLFTADADGRLTRTSYDSEGRLVATRRFATFAGLAVTGSSYGVATHGIASFPTETVADEVISRVYDADGRLRFSIDALGQPCGYEYDGSGNLLRKIEYAGSIAYVPSDTVATVQGKIAAAGLGVNAATRTTRSLYDGASRQAFAIDAAGGVTAYSYDVNSNVVKQVLFKDAYTGSDFSLTAMQNWSATRLGDARISRTIYDGASRIAYQADETQSGSHVSEYRYDGAGRLTKQIRYLGTYSVGDGTTRAQMQAAIPAIPASAAVTSYAYDGAGRLTDITDAENSNTHFVLDQSGLITHTVHASNVAADTSTTYRVFDKGGRISTETRGYLTPEASTTHYLYDGVGRATHIYAGYGTNDQSLTYRVFDAAGRVDSETRGYGTAEASTIDYGWDALGNLQTETDGRGYTIDRDFDLAGRATSESVPIDATTSAVTIRYYDRFGNVVKLKDPRGNFGYFYYDGMNRLTLQVDPEGYATKTTYTAGGEVGSVTRYAARATGAWSETVLPTINADTLKDSKTVFARDRLDRLTGITDAENFIESYTLDAFGNRIEVRNKLHGSVVDGVTLDTTVFFTFDRCGRVLSETLPITTRNAAGTTISVKNSYQYDARGNRTRTIEAEGAVEVRTTKLEYDDLDRLTKTEHDAVTVVNDDLTSTIGVIPTERIKYDRRGNVIERVDAGGARTLYWYDELDRAIAQVAQSERVAGVDRGTLTRTEYDGNGNATSVKTYGDLIALPADATGTIPSAADAGNYRLTSYTYYRDNRLKETIVAGLTTGQWNGSSYVLTPGSAGAAAEIRTLVEYDKSGNIVHEEDGRGNDVWSWYDKLGRKTAQVDAENYLTVWVLDAEGNATSEARYATRVASGFTPGADPPGVAGSAEDRITEFRYDRNGRRTEEQRLAVAHSRIDAVTGAASDYAAGHAESKSTITYSYNGLGQVLTRTEWSGAVTNSYDAMGRLVVETGPSFIDHQNGSVAPRTVQRYDGLNNVVSTRLQAGLVANDTNDRVTAFSYGPGGRLASMTDATGFTHNYGYDAAGRVVRDSYTRLKSDGVTALTEAQVTRYDLAGRAIVQASARLSGSTWVFTDEVGAGYDAVRIRYNAFGEMSGRGLTAGAGTAAVYQEIFDYDSGGRLWRSNASDGVLRFHVYDKAGNRTLTLASAGADLSALGVTNYFNSINSAGGTGTANAVTTVSVFDKRGQEIGSREPDRQLAAGTTVVIARARTYNAFGEVTSETDPRGFDSAGNAIAFGGGAGYTTTFAYNAMGRLTSKVSPQVSVTSENGGISAANPTEYFAYDLSGRLVSTIDANNNRTTRLLLAGSGRDGSDPLVVKEFHPDTGFTVTKYDVFGDARAHTNEVGSTELRDYDKLGWLTVQYHPVRPAESLGNPGLSTVQLVDYFGYDGLGRRTTHWNSQLGTAETERTDYDIQARIVSTITFGGDTTTYTYSWNASQATTGLGTFGGWARSTVNFASRTMTEAQDYFGRTVDRVDYGFHNYDFTFDLGGRLVARSNSTGESVAFTYYGTGQISGQTGTQGVAAYGYDSAGNRVSETFSKNGISYRSGTAAYDAMGRMTSWADSGFGGGAPASTSWEYDKAGNVRHIDSSYRALDLQGNIAATPTPISEWYLYDSMNRFTLIKGLLIGERGSGVIERGSEGTAFTYYFDGTRRSALHTETLLGSHWSYELNGQPVIIGGEQQGEWVIRTNGFQGDRREDYFYTADGFVAATNRADATSHPEGPAPGPNDWEAPEPVYHDPPAVGAWLTRSTLDAMGRTVNYKEYGGFDGTFERTAIAYDAAGRVHGETTYTTSRDTSGFPHTYKTIVSNTYTNRMLSQQINDTYKDGENATADGRLPDSRQTYSYNWWDGAVQASIGNDNDNGGAIDWTTDYFYDSSGHLTSATIDDGRFRTVTFRSDQNGMIVDRDEADTDLSKGDPRNLSYFFAGVQMGQISNNGTENMDYAAAIKERLAPLPTYLQGGAFRRGSTAPTPFADFAQGHDAINAHSNAPTGSSYTASGGETLALIAQNMWGNSQLWYLIAEANGLSGSETLVAGQVIAIPNKLHNDRNAADTFRVYDPNEAIGDTSPVDAKPAKKNKCAVVGQILLVAIAVAVTVLTHGAAVGFAATMLGTSATAAGAVIVGGAIAAAAGSIVSQAVGVTTGLQDKFDWKGVAMAALSGAVGGALGGGGAFGKAGAFGKIGSKLATDVLRGAVSNALTQGVSVATGLQKKFDWAGVAVGGVVGGVVGAVNRSLAGAHIGAANGTEAAAAATAGNYANQLGSGLAGAIAGAATRTILKGTDFGDNLMAALPDVIGSTIGNAAAAGITGSFGRNRPEELRGDFPTARKGIQLASTDLRLGLTRADLENGRSQFLDRYRAPAPEDDGTRGENITEDIVVTAKRLAGDAASIGERLLSNLLNSTLVIRITNAINYAKSDVNIGRTFLGTGARLVFGPTGSMVVNHFVSDRNAAASGRAVKDFGQATFGGLRTIAELASPLPNQTKVQVANGLANATIAAVEYTASRVSDPSLIRSDLSAARANIEARVEYFNSLDSAGKQEAIFYYGTRGTLELGSLAVGGEATILARGSRAVGATATVERTMAGGVIDVGANSGRHSLAAPRLTGFENVQGTVASTPGRVRTLVQRVDSPNPLTGAGYGVNNPPVRMAGEWSRSDIFNALYGRSPKGLGSPQLHHAEQMPGSGIHEILAKDHASQALHRNKFSQGVTKAMRSSDRELHWWYRAQEQGAWTLYPDRIYD